MPPNRDDPQKDTAWPARQALVWAWLRPATTARRTQHASLGSAFGVQVAAALLTALATSMLAAWIDERSVSAAPELLLATLMLELDDSPADIGAAILSTIVGIELGLVALAFLVMPWGARDERVRASFTHALRRTWLWTPQALPVVVLIALLIGGLERAEQRWSRSFDQAWPRPVTPYPQPPTVTDRRSPEWREYETKLQQHGQEWNAYWSERQRRQPWYLQSKDELLGVACCAAGAWALWTLLRAVSTQRHVVASVRPPLCEACGYDLTATALESRCPECGDPVGSSLGPDARPGGPWERRRALGRGRAWWRCSVDAIIRPAWLGRQLRLVPAECQHAWFIAAYLPLFFVAGAVGMFGVFFIAESPQRFTYIRWSEVLAAALLAGYFTMLFALAIAMASAALIGSYWAWRAGRNTLNLALRIAIYLSGYLALWSLVFFFTIGMTGLLARLAFERSRAASPASNIALIVFATFLAPNALLLIGYLMLVTRGTAAARYANNLPDDYHHEFEPAQSDQCVQA